MIMTKVIVLLLSSIPWLGTCQLLELAGGRFVANNDVSSWANLATDIAEMRESNDPAEIRNIYQNGRNARYVENGVQKTRSLASLSLTSFDIMKNDPMYSFFRHAFLELGNAVEGEQLGQFDNRPVAEYADTLVLDLLALNKTKPIPEAVIALNVWMYITHQLYEFLRACKNYDNTSADAMSRALDIAAALWIGADQQEGDNDSGNLLYNLAEVAGERFDQDRFESAVNGQVLDIFRTLRLGISEQTCSRDADGYTEIRSVIRKLIGHMTVPLIQNFIHHIQRDSSSLESDFIELYALSIGARVETCKPKAYVDMLELFVRSNFQSSSRQRAISLIQSIYTCLEVSCNAVGAYRSGAVPACNDQVNPDGTFYAGYPLTFDTTMSSKLDRDLLQIRILIKAGASDAALDYYQHGYNSAKGESFQTLEGLAKSPTRSTVTSQYSTFSTFFDDNDYADSIVKDALAKRGRFSGASIAQVMEVVSGTITNMVMYMAVLEKLYDALEACREANSADASVRLIDEAVAFYVGSIEGGVVGGNGGGQFLFSVGKDECEVFSSCAASGNSKGNQLIINAFKDASDALTEGKCENVVELIQRDIEPLMLVPLIQGTLNLAADNDDLEVGTLDPDLGTGFAFAYSVLPLIDSADQRSGTVIASNMNFQSDRRPVADGAQVVFNAVKTGARNLQTPNILSKCEVIGVFQDGSVGDICDGLAVTPVTLPSPTQPPRTAGLDGTAPPTRQPIQIVTDPPTPPTPAPQPVGQPQTVLGFGRYTFATLVDPIASISLDVRDMALASSVQAANTTYINGGNARSTGGDGTRVVSLSDVSTTAGTYMSEDPMFNLYRWALLDQKVFNDGNGDAVSDSAYAHVVVEKALGIAQDIGLAAETTVILHIWMEITHHIFDSIRECKAGLASSVGSIDRAIALWIGMDQRENDAGSGYMLYHIAEEVQENFGAVGGEAPSNKNLIDLFNRAQTITKQCQRAPDSFLDLKVLSREIFRQMSIPLFQKLIYHIDQGKENYIELYALGLIPQAVGCAETLYEDLRDTLVTEEDFDPSNIDLDFFANMKTLSRCLRITCDDLLAGINPTDAQLRKLLESSCYDPKDGPLDTTFAGYVAVNDVSEYARLDLDLLLIGIMMETNAYNASMDIYSNGYSTVDETGARPMSLSQLATSRNRDDVDDQFQIFSTFFSSQNYGDEIIRSILKSEGIWANTSREQRAEAVTRILQGMVMYMAVLEAIYSAVDNCDGTAQGVKQWDKGVALYVGSIEGPLRGGADTGDGTFLYALAKELCSKFKTCEVSGDAEINEFLLESFADGRDLLLDGDCKGATNVIVKEIVPTMPVALIQGALFYATENANPKLEPSAFQRASGYAFSQSIVPLINNVNATSAATLSRNLDIKDLLAPQVPDGTDAVFQAVSASLSGLGVDCTNIASFNGRTVCPVPSGITDIPTSSTGTGATTTTATGDVRPVTVVETPTKLANGIYTTSTYVQDRANIALDVAEIRKALDNGSNDLARIIYRDGKNSPIYNDNGNKIGQRSIMGFSTEATKEMAGEPVFSIFRYALQNGDNQFLGRDARVYADTIVDDLLNKSTPNSGGLAAEGMVALNLWMFLAHELFETLENCKQGKTTDADGIHSIDEAVAYWIGDGQVAGDGDNGHLLYALAEQMGDKFQMDSGGQSRTNANILGLFNQARLQVAIPNACSQTSQTYVNLRTVVNSIISHMTIPLIQSLIHYLRTNDRNRVKLYAQAFAPLTAACEPDLFAFLRDKLIDLTYNVVEVEEIVRRIRSSYDCLGLSCDDIGQHFSETDEVCVDTPPQNQLAGYRTTTDVRPYALLDLDILESSILMKMGAYDAVRDLYMHGKHANVKGLNGNEAISLSRFATTSDRTTVPSFDSYVRYFQDDKYADTFILRGLDASQLNGASTDQRTAMVVKSMQYLILHMAILQSLHEAQAGCESSDALKVAGSQEAWDKAAALAIGSIEGTDGTSNNGQSFYSLAKKRCNQFGTCGQSGQAVINERMISLFYAGKGELESGSCGAVRRTIKEIEPLLLVPLIQSNLRLTLENDKHKKGTPNADLAEGFVFSRSMLPLIDDANRESAEIIDRNMDFQFVRDPVVDGIGAVFNAFAQVYVKLGVECGMIGTVDRIDPCNVGSLSRRGSGGSSNGGLIAGIIIGLFAFMGLVTYFILGRRKKKRKLAEEEKPMFRRANGELNHDSDVLAMRHNDAALIGGEEAFDHKIQAQADALAMA